MALAFDVGISPRHLSFVETGRARPSPEVVMRIAARLGVPRGEENALLEAAGHARRHPHRPLSSDELAHVRNALGFVLRRMEPHGAVVFDGVWDIVMANEAHVRSRDFFLGGRGVPDEVRNNLLRLTFHPDGLRPFISNWDVVAPVLLDRVERELAEAPTNTRLRELLAEARSFGPVPERPPTDDQPTGVVLAVHLRRGDLEVRVFSLVSTLGSAIDVTAQELRMESFFPADAESEAALARLAGPGAR